MIYLKRVSVLNMTIGMPYFFIYLIRIHTSLPSNHWRIQKNDSNDNNQLFDYDLLLYFYAFIAFHCKYFKQAN